MNDDCHARIADLLADAEAIRGSEPQKAFALVDQAIELADIDAPHLRRELAQAHRLRCSLQLRFSDYPAALSSASKALVIFESLDDKEHVARTLDLLGVALCYQGQYPDAMQYFLKSEQIITDPSYQVDSQEWYAELLNNIGFTYVLMDEPEKSLSYLQKSQEIAKKAGNAEFLANGLDSLANAYLKMGDFDSALVNALESVECARNDGTAHFVAEYLLTVASVHIHREEYAQASEYIQQSIASAQANGFRYIEADALRMLGDVLQRQGQCDEAIRIIRQALAIAQDIGVKRTIYQCLYDLALLYKKTGDYATALDHFEQFHAVKSEVFSEQADWRIKSLETTHQVEQTRKENEIYQQANVALQKEIVEHIQAQALAEKLATMDSLTGLFNRRHFFDVANREIEQAYRYNRAISLAIIDLDHFKHVNDTHGHQAGDLVLSSTANIIQGSVRVGDIVCRYGGEEFAVLMPETNPAQGVLAIERIRKNLTTQGIDTKRGHISITFSAGIAGYDISELPPSVDLEILIKHADQALYDAKHTGRHKSVIHTVPS